MESEASTFTENRGKHETEIKRIDQNCGLEAIRLLRPFGGLRVIVSFPTCQETRSLVSREIVLGKLKIWKHLVLKKTWGNFHIISGNLVTVHLCDKISRYPKAQGLSDSKNPGSKYELPDKRLDFFSPETLSSL